MGIAFKCTNLLVPLHPLISGGQNSKTSTLLSHARTICCTGLLIEHLKKQISYGGDVGRYGNPV